MKRPFIPKQEIVELLSLNCTIFDIGCSNGYDIRSLFDYCKHLSPIMYGFEPDISELFKAKAVCVGNPEIKLFNLAVSDKNGFVDFNLVHGLYPNYEWYGDWRLANSILKMIDNPSNFSFEKTKVKSVTLDTFCEIHNIGNVDFIWMDVEGATEMVFRGATKTLQNTKYIYTEYSETERYEGEPNLSKITDLLKDHNFDLIEIFENDALFKKKE